MRMIAREWQGIVQRQRTDVLLENLLQDFHLLLLQCCHHIHTISQTLREGPYTNTNSHVTGVFRIYKQFLQNCEGVFGGLRVCINPAYHSFL